MLARVNYRGREVSLAGGVVAAVLLVALDPVPVVAVAGAAGLYDDLRGDRGTKGFRGHVRAAARGRLTSGAAKLLLIGGVALLTLGVRDGLLAAATANLANLFDLRPGRALKVVLLPALLARAWAVLAVALLVLPFDLRERTMLGDGGANALGAALGVALARALDGPATFAVLAGLTALTALSEVVSFSSVIDRVGPLRWLDRLGRPA
jgi:UDP-GlcNAc:undecaprenyl-phosphate GlcNAc-1-phosphate transferase